MLSLLQSLHVGVVEEVWVSVVLHVYTVFFVLEHQRTGFITTGLLTAPGILAQGTVVTVTLGLPLTPFLIAIDESVLI